MGGGGGVGVRFVGQSGCEQRIEVFVKIQKKKILGGGGGWVGGGVGGGGSGWGVRVDVNEELKFFLKIPKNIFFFLGGGGGRWGGGGSGEGSGWM